MRTTSRYLVLTSLLFSTAVFGQQWRYTGSMKQERRLHSTEILVTGKVLAAGGSDRNGVALKSAELYDPKTETWSDAAPMMLARERHTTTVAYDDKVYVIGGNIGDTRAIRETNSIEAFNPYTETWSHVGDLLKERQNHTATLLPDSTILITGGYNGSYLADCEIFDPRTGHSHAVASMHLGRHDHNAQLLQNGNVLVLGGRIGGAGGNYLDECEIYNPSTDTWTVIQKMYQPRISASVVAFSDNTVLVAGGRNSPTTIAPGAELFDGALSFWSAIAPIKMPCNWQSGVLMPGDRYMITGGYYDGDLSTNTILDATPTCEWYDNANKNWFYAPKLNLMRAEHGISYFKQSRNDELPHEIILVTGGIIGNNTFTNTCELLDVTEQALSYYMAHQSSSVKQLSDNTAWFVSEGSNNLVLHHPSGQVSAVELYAENGQKIATQVELGSHGTSFTELALPMLNNGLYFLRVQPVDGPLHTVKFVIAR